MDPSVSDEDVPHIDPPEKKTGHQTLNSLKAGLLDPEAIAKAAAKFKEINKKPDSKSKAKRK